jgi:hypothetical protein
MTRPSGGEVAAPTVGRESAQMGNPTLRRRSWRSGAGGFWKVRHGVTQVTALV